MAVNVNLFTSVPHAMAQWTTILSAPGSSPKYTVYAFILNSQICATFVLLKERK